MIAGPPSAVDERVVDPAEGRAGIEGDVLDAGLAQQVDDQSEP